MGRLRLSPESRGQRPEIGLAAEAAEMLLGDQPGLDRAGGSAGA